MHSCTHPSLVKEDSHILLNERCVSVLPSNTNIFMSEAHHPVYKCIVADPPWKENGGGKIKRGADKHYPLLSTEEISKLNIPAIADKDCWLYLWVTNNFLKEGIQVMESWGFRYINNIAWIKDRFGLGYYLRGNHELCLFGVKGNLKPRVRNIPSAFETPRRKHSQKPDKFFDLVETMSYGPRIEVFSRNQRDGWDVFGNEVSNSASFLNFSK